MRDVAKRLFENGVFSLFRAVDLNFQFLQIRFLHAQQMEGAKDDAKKDTLFIKFNHTRPIFILCMLLFAAGIAVLVAENHKTLAEYIRKSYLTYKSWLIKYRGSKNKKTSRNNFKKPPRR